MTNSSKTDGTGFEPVKLVKVPRHSKPFDAPMSDHPNLYTSPVLWYEPNSRNTIFCIGNTMSSATRDRRKLFQVASKGLGA